MTNLILKIKTSELFFKMNQNQTIEKIKSEVVYSESPTRLYELIIELNEMIGKLHVSVAKTEDAVKKAELRADISVCNAMLHIIEKRIDDVKNISTENDRKELLLNRQFRIAAELVLQKETFDKIKELSAMNYMKFKQIKADLKANKIE